VRIAGNITSRKVLGSIEFACAVVGVKLIVVMGHTRCGAVSAAVKLGSSSQSIAEATNCQHLDQIIHEIQKSAQTHAAHETSLLPAAELEKLVDHAARKNVLRTVETLTAESRTLERLAHEGKIAIVGAMYDVANGNLEFLTQPEKRAAQVHEKALL